MNLDFEIAMTEHVLKLVEARTSDLAPATYDIPVEVYLDEEYARRERESLFRSTPLLAALSCELREPGAFKAVTLAGTPLLLMRDQDGQVGAFFNACRHRGMKLTEGRGTGDRVTCPYHAWSYSSKGELVGVPRGPQSFTDMCRDDRGLVAVPSVERHGMIWVRLDPGGAIDIDAFLGDFGPELAGWEMDTWHFADSREHNARANWKLAVEGYCENYHVEFLHKGTLDQIAKSIGCYHTSFGDHQRMVFPNHPIDVLKDLPKEEWKPLEAGAISFIYHLFPGTIFALFFDHYEIFQIIPGRTADSSTTIQNFYTPSPVPEDERDGLLARFDFIYNLLQREDYWAVQQTQETLATGANQTLIFGRQEIALHHMHDAFARRLSAAAGEAR
jgi:phenylpropionate dioxygenase-like ring-hydroxylating dioxygenase large terminal subunit